MSLRKRLSFRFTLRADWVSLFGEDLAYEGDSGGHRLWRFTDGDAVGIFFFSAKPDLPKSPELAQFLSEYEKRIDTAGARLVECVVLGVRGLPMLRTIVKMPQKPHGMTGIREPALLTEGYRAKTVTFDPASANPITGSWNPDSEEFDRRFPQHPVSRLRRHLQEIPPCLGLNDRLLNYVRFGLPNTAGK